MFPKGIIIDCCSNIRLQAVPVLDSLERENEFLKKAGYGLGRKSLPTPLVLLLLNCILLLKLSMEYSFKKDP